MNQETVFTSINFDNNSFGLQSCEDHDYYCEYLEQCRKLGLMVYLTEYAAEPGAVEQPIDAYCEKNGFIYYISKSLELN